MKTLYFGILISVFAFTSCGPKFQSVSFVNKRTPLNPIAHRGVTNYNVVAELIYAIEVERQLQNYEQEVARVQQAYKEELDEYNSKSAAERIVLGIKKPELNLPPRPYVPYLYNEKELANRISIEGMNKGTENALQIKLEYFGFEEQNPKQSSKTKKTKKDDVEKIDTTYTYSAKVRHPMDVIALSPEGEEYKKQLKAAYNWRTLSSKAFSDSARAYNDLIDKIESAEEQIAIVNTDEANKLLNSEFGTQDVRYTVKIYTFKSNKRNDYSDLDQASTTAQYGFKVLNDNRNEGIENLNQAFMIWKNAADEYYNGKGRIKDKVMKGILKNLIVVSTFTENWEAGLKYMIQLENMKLKSRDRRDLSALKHRYNDLKSRYDALKEE